MIQLESSTSMHSMTARVPPGTWPILTRHGLVALLMTAITLAAPSPMLATAGGEAGPHPRVASYSLDVTFDPPRSWLSARAEIGLEDTRARSSVVLFLHGELEVQAVRIGDEPTEFRQEKAFYPSDYSLVATRVEVDTEGRDLDGPLDLEYEGFFHASKARSPSDYMRIEEEGILLRAYGYSLWFPVFLPPERDWYDADFEVILRAPSELVTVFAGQLQERRQEEGMTVSTWKAKALSLGAAQCSARSWVVQQSGETLVYSEADPGSRTKGRSILAYVGKLEERFRRWYRADVASGQLHVLQMPRYGDISSGNVVGLTGGIWAGIETDVNAKRALGHELVHPFVTPIVTRDDPLYSFAIEGFPSYFHLPALADLEGEEEYERFVRWIEHLYLEKRRTGEDRRGRPLPPEKPLLEISAEELSTYKDTFVLDDRALLLFDFLRRRLGKAAFFDLTRELFRRRKLDAARFEELLVRHLPEERDTIFRWLHTTEYPKEMRR